MDEALSEWTARHYNDRVSSVADGLRRLADQVEREGTPCTTASVDGTPRYTYAAQRVIKAIFWGVANLGSDGLINEAARADSAERGSTA